MPIYDRDPATSPAVVDRWEGGVGWLAHPEESARRASHAICGDGSGERGSSGNRTRSGDGVWLFDPLDAPGVDEVIEDLGPVSGVAVLSNYHARDAATVAERFDVPVWLPSWLDRPADRIDAPVRRYDRTLGDSGFRIHRYAPLPGWVEGVAYRESDGTLYVPEVLGTAPPYTVGDEAVGVYLLMRPFPPRRLLEPFEPDRLLVGHGTGVFDDAGAQLRDALRGARRRFPASLLSNGRPQLRALVGALGE